MNSLIEWLLEGDVSIQYLTRKHLLGKRESDLKPLRERIATEGWGKAYLDRRNPSGHWGRGFYQPKWICSHYTLLDLRYLEIRPIEPIMATLELILHKSRAQDGSITESKAGKSGCLCVNGMFLNYASFFGVQENELRSIVDYLLDNIMPDGGFNCEGKSKGAHHSSMHTTICVLEGIGEFARAGYKYRVDELHQAKTNAEEFLLFHQLFKSDKSGEIIDKRWTMLSFPHRWHYDLLRSLVYFADAGASYDPRMKDAVDVLASKRRKDGTWPLQAKIPGQFHFDMEPTGASSRFNTLRALRVLDFYGIY